MTDAWDVNAIALFGGGNEDFRRRYCHTQYTQQCAQ